MRLSNHTHRIKNSLVKINEKWLAPCEKSGDLRNCSTAYRTGQHSHLPKAHHPGKIHLISEDLLRSPVKVWKLWRRNRKFEAFWGNTLGQPTLSCLVSVKVSTGKHIISRIFFLQIESHLLGLEDGLSVVLEGLYILSLENMAKGELAKQTNKNTDL